MHVASPVVLTSHEVDLEKEENHIDPHFAIMQIPDQTLKTIDSFKEKRLGFILKSVYVTFPETQDYIDEALKEAAANKGHDKAEELLKAANFPLYPYHSKLSDFDPSCLNEQDQEIYKEITNLDFLTSDHPYVTIFGPINFGSEKLAIALGDAVCRSLHKVQYIKFHRLIKILQTHLIDSKANKQYEDLANTECLIVENFAGDPIHDPDLLTHLYHFFDARTEAQRDSVSIARAKNSSKIICRSNIITTCRAYGDWYHVFDADGDISTGLVSLIYGYGKLIYVDETNKPEAPTE